MTKTNLIVPDLFYFRLLAAGETFPFETGPYCFSLSGPDPSDLSREIFRKNDVYEHQIFFLRPYYPRVYVEEDIRDALILHVGSLDTHRIINYLKLAK